MSDNEISGQSLEGFDFQSLIAARDAVGLSSQAIQRELRLTSRVVSALESGQLLEAAPPVFMRGYIRAYCKRVGLDPEPYVAQFDKLSGESSPKRRSRISQLTKVKPGTIKVSSGEQGGRGRRLLAGVTKLIVVLLVIGGVGFGVSQFNIGDFSIEELYSELTGDESVAESNLPLTLGEDTQGLQLKLELEDQSEPPLDALSSGEEPQAIGVEPTVESLISESAQGPINSETTLVLPIPVAGTPVAGTPVAGNPVAGNPIAGTPAAGAPAAVVSGADAPSSDVAGSESSTQEVGVSEPSQGSSLVEGAASLQLEFADVSWINIKDASGETLYNGLSEKGRRLNLTGKAPISVVIGRSDAVNSLTFNGAVVDLEPFTRKNVARLTLPR